MARVGDAGIQLGGTPSPSWAPRSPPAQPHMGTQLQNLAFKGARTYAVRGWRIGRGRRKQIVISPTPFAVSVSL